MNGYPTHNPTPALFFTLVPRASAKMQFPTSKCIRRVVRICLGCGLGFRLGFVFLASAFPVQVWF